MIATADLLSAAARHLVGILAQIATAATNLITHAPTLSRGHIRAANNVGRLIELCCLLIARCADNPGYQPPTTAKPLQNSNQSTPSTKANAGHPNAPGKTPDAPKPPQLLESLLRPERPDAPVPGSHLSTPALVAAINRQLRLAAKAIGTKLPAELESLCREAIEAATQLENIGRNNPEAEPPPGQNPPINPESPPPPAPKPKPQFEPATTLEL